MPQSLDDYAQWLAERDLRWPAAPKFEPIAAAPFLKPLPGIKAVAWDVYGTLLRISDGELLFVHPQSLRMEVALDKTIQEFNMWQSMSRKPGKPWEYMLQLYTNAYDDLRLAGSGRKGDLPEVDSARIWLKILEKLDKNDYQYDEGQHGDLEHLSQKVAYFYHSCLQGLEASVGAASTVHALGEAGIRQGLLADGQCFTPTQMLRAFRAGGTLPEPAGWIAPKLSTLSFLEGVRKPSKSLYLAAAQRFRDAGFDPDQVLFVSSRLREDLVVAKSVGFRTALYAGEKLSLKATASDLKDQAVKPDRLLTQLTQVRDLLEL
ncbi:MAG TPA: HAD hydrolase-like protein [Planctomycetaceae bacterium]|nr:HAD hydrolase-like protein [Planctomycetaceae bacterium]